MNGEERALRHFAATLIDEHGMELEEEFQAAAEAVRSDEDAVDELDALAKRLEYTHTLLEQYVRLADGGEMAPIGRKRDE